MIGTGLYGPTIQKVADSILLTTFRGHAIKYCEVSVEEYAALCQEHFGGPWFGGLTIGGIPVRPRVPPGQVVWSNPEDPEQW